MINRRECLQRHARVDLVHTNAHSAALYVFRIVPNRMIYMHPKSKLIDAQSSEDRAENLVIGSSAAPSICKIVKMALLTHVVRTKRTKERGGYSRKEQHGNDIKSLPFPHNRVNKELPCFLQLCVLGRRDICIKSTMKIFMRIIHRCRFKCHLLDFW